MSPASPCRTFGTKHAESPDRGRHACCHRRGRGPSGACGRRRSGAPYHTVRRSFFLPSGEADNPGFGITKDTEYRLLRGKRRIVISIGESPFVSHPRFISYLSMPIQAECHLPELV